MSLSIEESRVLTADGSIAGVLYLSMLAQDGSSSSSKDCLKPCLEALLQASAEPVGESSVLMSLYYSENVPGPLVASRGQKTHTVDRSLDLTAQLGLAEIADTAVLEATACYEYLTGEKELFPQEEQIGDDEDHT